MIYQVEFLRAWRQCHLWVIWTYPTTTSRERYHCKANFWLSMEIPTWEMRIFAGLRYQESAYPTTATIIQEKTSGSILIRWHTCILCWVLQLDSPLFAWPSYPVQLQERHIFSSPMAYSISCTLQLTWSSISTGCKQDETCPCLQEFRTPLLATTSEGLPLQFRGTLHGTNSFG